MADWDRIERLRSKGWDWDRIAGDEKVDFHAEEGAGEPGRALRALYYQRRSRKQRRPTSSGKEEGVDSRSLDEKPRWTLARAAFVLTPLFGIWFLLAYEFPSPVGVYVTAIPVLAIFFAGTAAVLAFALLRSAEKWNRVYRNAAVIGVVLGLVVSGGLALTAYSQGCPNLTSALSPEPSGWNKAANAAWTSSGAPVFFFYGAYACPFCSASSWSMYYAFTKFGTVSGVQYGHSSSGDVFPNEPEIYVDQLSVQSSYVSVVAVENHDPTITQGPTPGSCIEQAYVSSYDTNGIPFLVVNGQFIHTGSLLPSGPPPTPDNMSQLQGLTGQQVMGQINNQSGPAWDAISPPAYVLMAYIVHVNGGQPSSVASIRQVKAILDQIH
jgi:hypothetical protein